MLLFEAWVWLYRLCSWMMHSRLEPMKELARLFRRHNLPDLRQLTY
jgi:hypothetical protein